VEGDELLGMAASRGGLRPPTPRSCVEVGLHGFDWLGTWST